jgi:hypothetical protein
MRKDEKGNECPATLGEYRDMLFALAGSDEKNKAVVFLDEKIDEQGRDEEVLAADSQMRVVLINLLIG